MKTLRSALAVSMLFLKPTLRQPLFLLLISTLPLSFLVIFRVLGGAQLSYHALYGMLVVFSVNAGVVSLPQLTLTYRSLRLQDMYCASPVGPGVYALGLGLSRFLFSLPPLTLVTAVLVARGQMAPAAVPAVAGVLLLTSFVGVMTGFLLSTLVANVYLISAAANLTGLLLVVLPPVYYPLEMVPAGWRWPALLLPTTNAAALLRISGGISHGDAAQWLLHAAILLAYALASGAFVFRRMRWQERA